MLNIAQLFHINLKIYDVSMNATTRRRCEPIVGREDRLSVNLAGFPNYQSVMK